MMTVPQAFALALQHHQAGRLGEAEALYRQILAAQPNHAEALHHLGIIAHQVGRDDLAIELIGRVLTLQPNNPSAHSNLGGALCALGRRGEGIAAFRRAIQLRPDYADAHNNLGNALREQGDIEAAASVLRRALEIKPDFAEAHNNLGIVLKEQGQIEQAVAKYRRALQLHPNYAEAYNNLGNALRDQGHLEEALSAFRRALQLKPVYPDARNNLGNTFKDQGRLEEALAEYRGVIETNSAFPEAYNNLGTVLEDQGRFDEAIAAYRRALELKPDYADAHNNLGNSLREQGRLDEAVEAFRQALRIKPNHPKAGSNLGTVLRDQGQMDEALATYRQALALMPDQAWIHSNLIYTLHSYPGCDGAGIAQEQERWNRQFGDRWKPATLSYPNDRDPDRRLRIGYVSPDFRKHAVGLNLVPLFKHHDHRSFEIRCYSGVIRSDEVTSELQLRADSWRSTVGLTDETLAEMIREDSVDILVDLSQHSGGNRLPVFARRPAPVQVSFAGYPESTGIEAIRYRISDRYLECGMDARDEIRNEHVFLIDSFWCYDPCGVELAVSDLPAIQRGHVTFGSLNQFSKINEPHLRSWVRVLRGTPGSRLVILSGLGSHRQRTLELLKQEGIEGDRVEFVERCSRLEYLEVHQRLDIILDTFPYNGHTTSLDALWMGVPVVSLAGGTGVSRGGLSILSNLDLAELVAHSPEEYVEIATRLAGDLARLAELRRTLRPRLETSVLMDAPRFAHHIESACRAMWRRWCADRTET